MLRYLDGQGHKRCRQGAVAQLVKLSDNLAGEVDRRHTTLTDSPGQRRIGFLCGPASSAFRDEALFDPQMATWSARIR